MLVIRKGTDTIGIVRSCFSLNQAVGTTVSTVLVIRPDVYSYVFSSFDETSAEGR